MHRPRRATSGRRPGLVEGVAPAKRRTHAEIQEEDERLAAAADAQHREEQEARASGIRRVAEKEDEMRCEDEKTRMHATRPDLVSGDEEMQSEEHSESGSEDDRPPPSGIDTDSDGMTLGTEDAEDDFLADGDDDRDDDYQPDRNDSPHLQNEDVSDSQDGGEISGDDPVDMQKAFAEFLKMKAAKNTEKKDKGKSFAKGKPAKKVSKGALRSEIVNTREIAPVPSVSAGSASKRKADAAARLDPPPVPKRAKPAELGGLKPGWKKAVEILDTRSRSRSQGRPSTTSQSRASSRSSGTMHTATSSERDDVGGAFENDEPEVSLQAAKTSKSAIGAAKSSRNGQPGARGATGTAKMGITLTPVTPATGSEPSKRQPKPKYKNEDLPFAPQHYRDNLRLWQTHALGKIIDWAGSIDDLSPRAMATPISPPPSAKHGRDISPGSP
ncbi:hypothetical protein B0H17DRAFT_173302 [Mycena rosella]|uniref:Uncharacterized protein n=1 Tax=Mycena rosella TaxID=1033263 RepID=A0AAD7G754_MYCRO|nr:hypothetical protein B0H17DRAFT_173302 [Mycena rosella]